ncbi:N-acetylneuraminate synthase [Modicisalibacter tunisiensis]|uniref:N-acetylneuraminate synthase n=1 Tax=Modicisalibacter tunisiensis TaxID=390637 RepID=UPI001CCDEA29|nr:N-acetylneuraminate synthase [Modicisalibacter tunisiensis]MBZ9538039.1 N-acetylneuraminate synthase [Modicisalibacter tunisiensis]
MTLKEVVTTRPDTSTFVIAEAGVNHNGSLEMALALVARARECGADAVKFQAFRAERLATRAAPKAAYQRQATTDTAPGDDSQYAMLRSLELSEDDFVRIQAHCRACGIEFLASAFDEDSAGFLDGLGMRLFKIPSGEVTNHPLLARIGAFGRPIILSTGMCHLGEVEAALHVLESAGAGPVTLLHCVTEYPAPFSQINLAAMETLARAFGVPVGYSDHTAGIEIPVAAVAMGATVIEKHFTLDTTLPGPDHAASLASDEFRHMVEAIRHVEQARGDGRKRPASCELDNLAVVRRSIAAGRDIAAGERITVAELVLKRPGNGLAPDCLAGVVGRRAARAIAADQLIDWQDLA